VLARRRRGWARLYVILLAGVGLCLVGYRLGTTPLLATLLQLGAVLIILGLLSGWVRGTLPFLLREGTDAVCTPQPFSALRLRLRSQRRGAGGAVAGLSARRRAAALRLGARKLSKSSL
jgi:hypothetical protein